MEQIFYWEGAENLAVSSSWLSVRITGERIVGQTVNGARYRMTVRAQKGDESAPCGIWLETENGVMISDAAAPVKSEDDPEYIGSWILNTYEGRFTPIDGNFTDLFDAQAELKIANPLISGFTQGITVLMEITVYVDASAVWEAVSYDGNDWIACDVLLFDGAAWQNQALSFFDGTEW